MNEAMGWISPMEPSPMVPPYVLGRAKARVSARGLRECPLEVCEIVPQRACGSLWKKGLRECLEA